MKPPLVIVLRCDGCMRAVASGPATETGTKFLLAIADEHVCPPKPVILPNLYADYGDEIGERVARGLPPEGQMSKEEIDRMVAEGEAEKARRG